MGGYGRGELAPFGEPIAKAFVDEAMNEARKLENGLRSLRTERSVAVLHYSPTIDTLRRRARGDLPISRLAAPGRRDRPLRPCEGGGPRPRASRHIRGADAARHAGLQCRAVRAEAAVRQALRGARNLALCPRPGSASACPAPRSRRAASPARSDHDGKRRREDDAQACRTGRRSAMQREEQHDARKIDRILLDERRQTDSPRTAGRRSRAAITHKRELRADGQRKQDRRNRGDDRPGERE